MKVFVSCPECAVTLEIDRFDGTCKCYACGRDVVAVHDCDYDYETGDGDCYDFAELAEDT